VSPQEAVVLCLSKTTVTAANPCTKLVWLSGCSKVFKLICTRDATGILDNGQQSIVPAANNYILNYETREITRKSKAEAEPFRDISRFS
jgi:hypothetical protein